MTIPTPIPNPAATPNLEIDNLKKLSGLIHGYYGPEIGREYECFLEENSHNPRLRKEDLPDRLRLMVETVSSLKARK